MKIAGIIAEYNPFHKGHQYQIEYTKKSLGADFIVVAMSGDYVQRGTPALLPKNVRAEMALRCGADLVLELPVSGATASAEFFAKGGVELLERLGVVEFLSFGSEAGETENLMKLASLLTEEPKEYKNFLKAALSSGLSYPAARSQAVLHYFKDISPLPEIPDGESAELLLHQLEEILASPNNILGIEYCKAILRLKSSIKPCTVKRKGSGYHDATASKEAFASATAIRRLVTGDSAPKPSTAGAPSEAGFYDLYKEASALLPAEAGRLLEGSLKRGAFVTENDFDSILHYCLLRENADTLRTFLDVSPELAQRMMNQRNFFQSFTQFAALLKTKEITQTRIQRALLHILLDIREPQPAISHARVLGFRRDSGTLLKEIKKNSRIPLLTKLADAPSVLDAEAMKLLEKDTFASNLYESVLSRKTGVPFRHEYQKAPVIL